ncbi:hypothetical protein [Gordonia aichiensis]
MITTKQIEKLVELAIARRDNLAKADRDIYGADFDAITKINAACRRIENQTGVWLTSLPNEAEVAEAGSFEAAVVTKLVDLAERRGVAIELV